jgi:hypothetical protein
VTRATRATHAEQPAESTPKSLWPLPARWIDHLTLGSAPLTRLYWAGVMLVVAGLFVTQLLPCVDYPQHLALSDVARRLLDPGAPEQADYQLNYFTYNGLFHVTVARLSEVVSIELAGRLVVATSLVGMAAAVVALVRTLRRPPEHAALFTPILFSFSLGWGFVNYVLATAVAAWALVVVVHAVVRPSFVTLGALAALGLVCAFAHVLAMLILCATAFALGLELSWRVTPPSPSGALGRPVRALLRCALALLPLAVGCAYCVAVYRHQYDWDPNMYRDPTMEGSSPPLWQKIVFFSAFATDLFHDATDQVVLWVTLVVMASSAWLSWKTRRAPKPAGALDAEAPPPIVLPFAVLTLAYFVTPMVFIGTHLIFPRLAQWTVLGALLATPRFPGTLAERARVWLPRLGLVAGVNTLLHCALFGWETSDASATIDDLPVGGAATAVIWEPSTAAFRNGALTHLAAYYAARKHGRWAFAFARYLSVPVRFKPGGQPAWPAVGWEFDGESYDARCKYARAFPLVIVKAPSQLPRDASGEPLVRKLVFKQDAAAVTLLSHHGRYWAFDSTGLPDDGTL